MRYPAEETAKRHELLVKKASEMVRERGFEQVSVAEVMQAAGLTHGAFYSHFGSKTELMGAAIERAMEGSREGVAKSFATAEGRTRYIENYLSEAHRERVAEGCAMAALSGELRHEPELQAVFARKLEEIVAAMGEPRAEAIVTVATMVGAMSLARAVGESALSAEILEAVKEGVLPDGPAARGAVPS